MIMKNDNPLSRREFLKLGGLTAGGLALNSWDHRYQFDPFPDGEMLARVTTEYVNVRSRPDLSSELVGTLLEDEVVPCLREVVGGRFSMPYFQSQRWIETPVGFIWSPLMQPVDNLPNSPILQLNETSLGPGLWVEVTVPWVDLVLVNSEPMSPALRYRVDEGKPPRLYYSQIIWVDQIKMDENQQVWYRINERYGYGDIFWGKAEAFRPLTREEISPINPESENKRIDINLLKQTLSCYENDREVYFCRVSTGTDGEDTETPPGLYYYIWRKMLSAHMAGGTVAGGYDLAGVGFTTLFQGDGIAIHSTFWHNRYGEKTSHGCVNVSPADAKWIWRWTTPYVGYDPGDITIEGYAGTNIRVFEN
jgi:lipoprotein-anchoring transpeptidase ErfK/SrfK